MYYTNSPPKYFGKQNCMENVFFGLVTLNQYIFPITKSNQYVIEIENFNFFVFITVFYFHIIKFIN